MELRELQPNTGIHVSHRDAAHALMGLIGCIGDPQFGQRGLEQLDRVLPLGWWTIYRVFDDAPPKLHLGGCLAPAVDCVAEAFSSYRAGLWRQDRALDDVRECIGNGGHGVLTHLHAQELSPEHRRRIFERHGLSERLSLACEDADGALLSVNLYRQESQPAFCDDERDTLQALGPWIMSCVVRHLTLRPSESAIDVFQSLTRREREVCERLLRGWTHDGIAADLQLGASTIKTYRDRAFSRLGIHHRHELFALALGTCHTSL